MITHGNSLDQVASPRRSRWRYVVPAILAVPIIAAVALAVVTVRSNPTIRVGDQSLAQVTLPFGGGTIERVTAVKAPEQSVVPVHLIGNQVWPDGKLPAGEHLTIAVTVKRPGWISWLSGSTEQIKLTETTPVARVTSKFVTRHRGHPITVKFSGPAAVVAYRRTGATTLSRHVLHAPQSTYDIHQRGVAGTMTVASAARSWEQLQPTVVSWFPAGARATAVATPAPGSAITPATGITLRFSKRVGKVLGSHLPPVSPATQGAWHRLNAHTIRFEPTGYGYGLGAHVSINLPAGVNLVGGQPNGSDPVGRWTVPQGSTLRLQQLLAQLGYLPVNFNPTNGPVANTIAGQETAAVSPPQGNFSWRYHHTPPELKALWAPGKWGELTKGAVMSFENSLGMTADGVPGPAVWKALMDAAVKGQKSTFGYTFVHVSESLPQTIHVWHNGKTVVSGLANTGIPASPTALGTYAVYIHIPVGTMSGTNPDGSTYHDTGIPWISYFNGGDALHGFIRASYGFPQSLGCVEMPFAEAGKVYPYTPIGTIVNIVS